MSEQGRAAGGVRRGDWAGNWRTFAALWGVPASAMAAATLLDAEPRAVIWSIALAWMGVACLMNARRCGRTHCRLTGPFFLLMVGPVIGHAAGLLPLGGHGWLLLGGTALVGSAIIWWASERALGRFPQTERKSERDCR